MNEPREDRELQNYLDGKSDESRQYAQLGAEEPPPDVDARILAEAERAVKVRKLPAHRAPPFKAFAWAAVVVLSFSLVLNILFREPALDPLPATAPLARESDAPVIYAEREQAEMGETVVTARKSERKYAAQANEEVPPEQPAAAPLPASPGRLAASADDADTFVGLAGTASGYAQDSVTGSLQVVTEYFEDDRKTAADTRQSLLESMSAPAEIEDDALRRILRLHEGGETATALHELSEFRERFPEHPVSVRLEELGL